MSSDDVSNVCAPGVKFLGGSCITIDLLEDMITVYNKNHDNKIDTHDISKLKNLNPITYKKRMVDIIQERMKDYKCDTQTCWLTLPFFKQLTSTKNTIKLHRHTFKPEGPRNTTEWLNTYNINDVFAQYEEVYPEFKFMGALPRDFDMLKTTKIRESELEKLVISGKTKMGVVFNLDEHDESGSHWVALYADLLKKQIYFIDSVGEQPAKEFKILMKRIKVFCDSDVIKKFCSTYKNINDCKNFGTIPFDIRYNKKQHQHGNSECGVYAISFILRLLDGETFDDIEGRRISDEEIKMCRMSYFRTRK